MLKRRTVSCSQIRTFHPRFERHVGIQVELLKVNVSPLLRAVDDFCLIQHWVGHLIFPSLCAFLLQVVPSLSESPITLAPSGPSPWGQSGQSVFCCLVLPALTTLSHDAHSAFLETLSHHPSGFLKATFYGWLNIFSWNGLVFSK